MTIKEGKKIQESIKKAFADVPKPYLENIPVLGCCPEHEPDYQWYRQISWQEFDLAHDPADFLTLHPLAYYYFTPGVLLAAIESLEKRSENSWHDESWFHSFIIADDQIADFKRTYLSYYNQKQRQCVAAALAWYKQWYYAENG